MRPRPALLLALLLSATLAGCTLGGGPAATPRGDDPLATVGSDAAFRVQVATPALNATPGHRVDYAVTLGCPAPTTQMVEARVVGPDGLEGAWTRVPLDAACHATVFAPLDVPADAPEGKEIPLAVEVRQEGVLARRAPDAATLRVMGPAPGWTPGATAFVAYTARLADTGAVVFTNEPGLASLPYARAPEHQGSATLLRVGPGARGVPEALVDALEGMQAGETRVVVAPPEKAYGNATVLAREAREEAVPRDHLVEVVDEAMAWDTFAAHVRASGQGNPEDFDVNHTFVIAQGGNAWPYRITAMSDQRVDYRLDARPGQRYTLYPFWPQGSEVLAATDHQVAFYTTPTTAEGERFTMRAAWPGMTEVVALDHAEIRVRHSPTVGLAYERPGLGGAKESVVVRDVTETHVVLAVANPHPLAGRTLVLAARVEALETA